MTEGDPMTEEDSVTEEGRMAAEGLIAPLKIPMLDSPAFAGSRLYAD